MDVRWKKFITDASILRHSLKEFGIEAINIPIELLLHLYAILFNTKENHLYLKRRHWSCKFLFTTK